MCWIYFYFILKSGLTLGRVILFPITDRVMFLSLIQHFQGESKWPMYSLEPLTQSTCILSSRYCKFLPVRIIWSRLTRKQKKLPIDSLACPILYRGCHLCLHNRNSFGSNVSYRYTPHHTCSSSPSCYWNSRMDVCFWSSRKCSSSICYWYDGCTIGDSKFTTFVRIFPTFFSF